MADAGTAALRDLIRAGSRIAIADGVGAPRAVSAELSALARGYGDVSLLLGWVPAADPGLDLTAFAEVRALMGGWGLRRAIDTGHVRYLPVALGATPALVRGPLRPDVLVAALVEVPGGFAFGSEVSWMRAAVGAGTVVAAVVNDALPRADAGPPLPADQVVVVARANQPPLEIPPARIGPEHAAIARHVVTLIPSGARVQVGPGPLGAATLDALRVPVYLDTGLILDGVVDLAERGLLAGSSMANPMGAYLAGSRRLYAWADQRPILHPVEVTHDAHRLSTGIPLIAVNTALEVDLDAQVNVEGTAASTLGGIGGHPDFAAGAARSDGLSVIAVPTRHARRYTLVDRLSRPTSTPAHDVDVVVTEQGAADLRGLDRAERRNALLRLWGRQP
ncbi:MULTISPECIES: acetyl-CoA hydrolase/transferase C-terminal domain-containing protein [unclassified Frankia]|uniref:acetyl-CoA hydrolase/transferase C-terminal domain-containing protein n=1 Tax=unclassified Frankia TaxID=2632575 RepID=UPI002AD2C418|nr:MULTISPECIES: acetyl-CoA hydrolase/transferase C-terminal domain-containing protein [unclassified Frankia]